MPTVKGGTTAGRPTIGIDANYDYYDSTLRRTITWDFALGQWITSTAPDIATSTELDDKTSSINNNPGKAKGFMCFNTTTSTPVYANGNTDVSPWFNTVGGVVHAPV